MGSEIVGVVINMLDSKNQGMKESEISSLLQAPILEKIPMSDEIKNSVFKGKPFVLISNKNELLKGFRNIAYHVTGEEYKGEVRKKSLFDRIFGFFIL